MNPERKIHPVISNEAPVEKQPAVLSVVKDDFVLSQTSDPVNEEVKLSELAEMFKKADQSVLLSFDSNGKETFKKLGDVIKEIEAVLLCQENLNEKEVRDYMEGIVSRLRQDIQLSSQGIANEKQDKQRRLDLMEVRNKKYEELLESVAAFLETGEAKIEPVVEVFEAPAVVSETFAEKINFLKNKFKDYKALLKEKGGVIKTSPACKRAKNIINKINNLKEADSTTRKNIERTYLRYLDRALVNLGGEITLLSFESPANENNIEVGEKDFETENG